MKFNRQVKSKKRVVDFGEVYTNPREVRAMLDMVKSECNNIESTFLEPACGNGNFMVEILRRKLYILARKYGKNQKDYEVNLLKVVGSIYGVDIQSDNCIESRSLMYNEILRRYKRRFKQNADMLVMKSVEFILSQNIICGNFLKCIQNDGKPILIPQWIIDNEYVQRQDYLLSDMIEIKNQSELNPVASYPLVYYKSLCMEEW